jgi:hypothetical protein
VQISGVVMDEKRVGVGYLCATDSSLRQSIEFTSYFGCCVSWWSLVEREMMVD